MGMVAPQQRIASAFVVCFGPFGAVSQHARQRGMSRQRVYREAAWVASRVDGSPYQSEVDQLRQDNRLLQQSLREAEQRLEQAVVLDEDRQAEFATVGQGIGVSLPEVRVLLDVLLPGKIPSVAKLGRWTQAVGQKAGPLLAVVAAAVERLMGPVVEKFTRIPETGPRLLFTWTIRGAKLPP